VASEDVSDAPALKTYAAHIGQQVVTRDLRIQEAYMQQFIAIQRNLGTDSLPSDPMKYVDSSLLDRALAA
jgi:hypothetical protein